MSRSNQRKREPITDRHTVLQFGKWKGSTIDELLLDAPDYLVWLHENTDFELGHELLEEAENNGKPNHEFKGWTGRSEHADRINADGEAADFYEPF